MKHIFQQMPSYRLSRACGNSNYNASEDKGNVSGNNNSSDDNKGNHANTPRQEPGTVYPGSAPDSSAHHDPIPKK